MGHLLLEYLEPRETITRVVVFFVIFFSHFPFFESTGLTPSGPPPAAGAAIPPTTYLLKTPLPLWRQGEVFETLPLRLSGETNMPSAFRPDRDGKHRAQFDKNKKKIYATQTVCGICGKPVDMSLKWPHPWSKCIDHIVPVSKGGHPSDINNLQLAHVQCNRSKGDKLFSDQKENKPKKDITNRILPQSRNWMKYKSAP